MRIVSVLGSTALQVPHVKLPTTGVPRGRIATLLRPMPGTFVKGGNGCGVPQAQRQIHSSSSTNSASYRSRHLVFAGILEKLAESSLRSSDRLAYD
jgi:hypothetical protein